MEEGGAEVKSKEGEAARKARQQVELLQEELRSAQAKLRDAKQEEARAEKSSKTGASSKVPLSVDDAASMSAIGAPTPALAKGAKAAGRQRQAPSVFSPSLFVQLAAGDADGGEDEKAEKRDRSAAELELLAERVRINPLG